MLTSLLRSFEVKAPSRLDVRDQCQSETKRVFVAIVLDGMLSAAQWRGQVVRRQQVHDHGPRISRSYPGTGERTWYR